MSDEYKDCGELATIRYTWPGKDEAVCCINHAKQLQHIAAAALGMHLQMISITYRSGEITIEFPTCKQRVKVKL